MPARSPGAGRDTTRAESSALSSSNQSRGWALANLPPQPEPSQGEHLRARRSPALNSRSHSMVVLRAALTVIVLLALSVSSAAAQPDFSDWAAPVNLGPIVNSSFTEGGPAISKDGLSLYFHSERPGSHGSTDIWVSVRERDDQPWGAPMQPRRGRQHAWSRGGRRPVPRRALAVLHQRPERRLGKHGHLGLVPRSHSRPLRLATSAGMPAPGSISVFGESAPSYFENDGGAPQLFFHSNRPGGLGGTDIYVSELSAERDVRSGEPGRGAQ